MGKLKDFGVIVISLRLSFSKVSDIKIFYYDYDHNTAFHENFIAGINHLE
ncbi:hypothetical protein LF887_13445 [Chryseobacterium sp. MEBOG06]|nr:hypothetical protein [Chryseobacterium sp. MEBOG06]UKB82009.1 hypothetical protein LF887_13445 [Chryseobacterium sp. MEBOG06]